MLHGATAVTLVSFAALLLAYRWYGRYLAKRIFQLDPLRRTPSHTKRDGVDFVPTRVPVLFGHHFASIAGLGPILGPAIGVIWGWVPAVLWVVLGSIFMGAVHDLGALTVSLRYRGRSIGGVCQDLMGSRARLLFLIVIFFLMSLAMGAFVNAIAELFVDFNPDAIIPSFGLMLVAMGVGLAVYRLGVNLTLATAIGLLAFGGLIYYGMEQPVLSYEWSVSSATKGELAASREAVRFDGTPQLERPYGAAAELAYLKSIGESEAADDLQAATATAKRNWIYVLLAYGFLASVLPVWLLLQPRDYINSFQLYIAVGLLLTGLVLAGIIGAPQNEINAPAFRSADDFTRPEDTPLPLFPFLFVTIACGAVSGFHSLVSSGTTVRQLNRESDALPIGFGAMLTEGALAVLVIMACVAGLGPEAWKAGGAYSSWSGLSGGGNLAVQLNAFLAGGAQFMNLLGIPTKLGMTFLAVTVVAFALTTLDSATRLLRFNVEEMFHSVGLKSLANRYIASLVAVAGIAFFGLSAGGTTLWILFGSGNQLLAGLTLLTVSLFLFKLGKPTIYTLVPTGIMLTMTIWALGYSMIGFWNEDRWLLFGVSSVVMVLTFWLIVEGILSFLRGRGQLDFGDDDLRAIEAAEEQEVRKAVAAAELG